jgi:MFS family permease
VATAVRARARLPGALGAAPLAGSYPAAVALALLALCPFIVLTTATTLFQRDLTADLRTSRFGVELAAGLANAAYAFGAVGAADLVQRLPPRRLCLWCEALFVAGTALLAPSIVPFTVGRVFQGLATGMLLVAALPPLVTKHGAERLPSTAAFVNLGLFGMVTLGPLLGGVAGSLHAWRALFAAVGVLGLAGLVMAALAFEHGDAGAAGMGFDWLAIPLAIGATVLPFFGVAWLSEGGFGSVAFLAPLGAGLAVLGALIAGQYRKPRALMPVELISHTLPVVGTLGAMVVGAAFTALLELVELYLLMGLHMAPASIGGLVAAQIAGVAIAAWLFRRLLPTRWTPVLALSGLVAVALAAAGLLGLGPSSATAIVPVAALLLGFGAGAGVTPGLFLAGFSVPSRRIGPTFALVELLRSEAAFLVGPILLALAIGAAGLRAGVHEATLIVLLLTVVSGIGLAAIYLLGGARPHPPDLEAWIGGEETAYHSPPFAARLRRGAR